MSKRNGEPPTQPEPPPYRSPLTALLHDTKHACLRTSSDECFSVRGGNDHAGFSLAPPGQAGHEIAQRAMGPFPVGGFHLQKNFVPCSPDSLACQGHDEVSFALAR